MHNARFYFIIGVRTSIWKWCGFYLGASGNEKLTKISITTGDRPWKVWCITLQQFALVQIGTLQQIEVTAAKSSVCATNADITGEEFFFFCINLH